MNRLVVGCGYLGKRVAQLWREQGDRVWVTTRSYERAAQLADQGFSPLICDVTQPSSFRCFGELTSLHDVLFSVGYDRSAGHSIEDVYVTGLKNIVQVLPSVDRLIYISTTGVYGQSQGEQVDEQSECQPTRDGGLACLAAEQLLQTSESARSTIILRLAGIYGPGRVPNQGKLRAGEEVVAPEDSYLNLIHVDDGAAAIRACEAIDAEGCHLFVVSDNHPVLRREYYREVARLCDLDPAEINFVDTASQSNSPPESERKVGSKRVCADHLLSTLELQLRYPSYQEGLASILGTDGC